MSFASAQSTNNAISSLEYQARQGDPHALLALGLQRIRGGAVLRSYTDGASLVQRAAYRGLAEAQFELALLHRSGSGVEQSVKEEFIWLAIAASQGHPYAVIELDMMISGVDRPHRERWLLEARERISQ